LALLGIRLIDIRAILLDPVDLRGLPTVEQGRVAWAIPAFLPEDGAGILSVDELNAAPPLVQAACYQLVLDRALGEYRLPDGWTVFAAGMAVTMNIGPGVLANFGPPPGCLIC
jgi:MoxR-like ATPase